jgi:hypothetical protein
MLQKDDTLCDNIQLTVPGIWCPALANGNLPDCTKLTSMENTICQALTQQNPDKCATLTDTSDQDDCYKYYNQYQLR